MKNGKKRRRGGGRTLILLLLLVLAALVCRDNLQVRTVGYDLRFPDLPEGFDGLKIMQISDLHGRDILARQLLIRAEAEAPDLILLTGDLVDREGQLARLEPLIRELAAIAPAYYVTGNHEWALADTEGFLRDLSSLGVTLLRNSFVTLERSGDRLLLAGVEDPNGYADMKTPEELARELEAAGGGFSLLLAHRPELFPDYAALGFRVVFSGHTHGGMLRLPFLGGVLAPGHVLFPEYDGGLFTLGGSTMVLSRGLAGVNGLPRIFNPMEVPVAVLHRG
ncbi:MAG: metallophosphoesterase [Oscillospiraceae bacterium]|nr:metallophosphoesterase [Oscillospiraceae bacterium]